VKIQHGYEKRANTMYYLKSNTFGVGLFLLYEYQLSLTA